MTSTGMRSDPDPQDPHGGDSRSKAEAVPGEEGLDPATIDEDLALEPDEKRNATDGYAPADDDVEPTAAQDFEQSDD